MECLVDTFEVGDSNFLAKNHLVEAWNKEGVEEASMEDGHSDDATDKLEVG